MDGARFANALATTGESPADVTWRAGVDALSFGFVKNGGLNAEALILFRTELADEIAVRRKRAGHLLSKGRVLAAQILAMLEDDLWLDNARAANAAAQTLAEAAQQRLVYPVEANELFLRDQRRRSRRRCATRASTSTTGGRAKSGWSRAGTSRAATSTASPRRSPPCDRGRRPTFRPSLPFIIFTAIWGSTWIVIRDQLGTVPPQWSVAYRFIIAALAMAVLAEWRGDSLNLGRKGMSRRSSSASPNSASTSTPSISPSATSPRASSRRCSRCSSSPPACIGWAFLGHRPSKRFAWCTLVAVAGIALLFVHEIREHPADSRQIAAGIGLTLVGMLGASIANVSQARPEIRRFPLFGLLAWSMAAGAVIDGAFAFALAGPPVFDPRPGYWLGVCLSRTARLGPDLQPLLSGGPQDRPGQGGLFKRPRADHRHGLFDLARGLSLDRPDHRRRGPRAWRHGPRAPPRPLGRPGSRRRLKRLGAMPSSVIRRFVYDEMEHDLWVEFITGRKYVYSGVPEDVAAAFGGAFSKGVYFNTRIRDSFPFREVAREETSEG